MHNIFLYRYILLYILHNIMNKRIRYVYKSCNCKHASCWFICINISCWHRICIRICLHIIYEYDLISLKYINLVSLKFYLQALQLPTRIRVGAFVSILAAHTTFAFVSALGWSVVSTFLSSFW